MRTTIIGASVAALVVVGLSDAALAFGSGGGSSGSGLSPYSALSGNDRSAGVNNGNYRDPRIDPYLGAYGDGRGRPAYYHRAPPPRPYYGYPY